MGLINLYFFVLKDEDVISELRRALGESEKKNEEINREFQKLLRLKEVLLHLVFTCKFARNYDKPGIYLV